MDNKPKIIFNHQAPTIEEAAGMFSDFEERIVKKIGSLIKGKYKDTPESKSYEIDKPSKLYQKMLEDAEELGVDINNPVQVFALGYVINTVIRKYGKLSKDLKGKPMEDLEKDIVGLIDDIKKKHPEVAVELVKVAQEAGVDVDKYSSQQHSDGKGGEEIITDEDGKVRTKNSPKIPKEELN